MINRYVTLLMLLLSSMFASISMAEETLNATVDRAWGLLLGDEVNVHVDIRSLELGINKSIRDIIQNHALNDVSSKHYDRWDYMPEKREALEKWSHYLECKLMS